MKITSIVFTWLALMLAGCAMPDNRDADAKALRDNETQWNLDFAAKDVDKLVAHYADDAVLIGPGMPATSGRDSIRKTLQGMISDPALSLKFHLSKVEIARSGDIGYTQGTYTLVMTETATQTVSHGSRQLCHDLPQTSRWLVEGRGRHCEL